jgi:hypothetical protein
LDRALDQASRALDRGEVKLEAADARAMPERLEQLARAGARVLAYQTVFIDYLRPEAREAYVTAMRAFVGRHPGRAMWTELERASDGSAHAELRVHTHDADRVLLSCDYHPTRCVRSGEPGGPVPPTAQ